MSDLFFSPSIGSIFCWLYHHPDCSLGFSFFSIFQVIHTHHSPPISRFLCPSRKEDKLGVVIGSAGEASWSAIVALLLSLSVSLEDYIQKQRKNVRGMMCIVFHIFTFICKIQIKKCFYWISLIYGHFNLVSSPSPSSFLASSALIAWCGARLRCGTSCATALCCRIHGCAALRPHCTRC